MVRYEFKVLVRVLRFPADSDRDGVVTVSLDECVQEWELGILFSFHSKLCLGVETVDMLKEVMYRLEFRMIEKTSST